MRKRLVAAILLIAILTTVGLTGRSRPLESASANEAPRRTAAMPPAEKVDGAARPSAALASPRKLEPVRAPMAAAATLRALSEEASAVLAATCELQLMAQGTGLELSSEQWTALAKVTLDLQAIRQTYEAEIATATRVSPGRYRVEIPVYARTGDALRERLQANLRAAVGESAAAAVAERLGPRLEGYFAGFGVSVQTLEIVGDSRGAQADYEVTRTVQYWDSVAGRDELTTRRETHLPAWEDPAGERWGALLARLES